LSFVLAIIVIYLFRKNKSLNKNQKKKVVKGKKLEESARDVELESLRQQLAAKDLQLNAMNSSLIKTKEALQEFYKTHNEPAPLKSELLKLQRIVEQNELKGGWLQFREQFESIHPHFFKRIQKQYNNLSSGELRLCAYIKMKLSPKEIANQLNIDNNSIIKARYRLKKKMKLNKEDQLDQHIRQI